MIKYLVIVLFAAGYSLFIWHLGIVSIKADFALAAISGALYALYVLHGLLFNNTIWMGIVRAEPSGSIAMRVMAFFIACAALILPLVLFF